jgi:LuxR family maltose regulon positive regulatory protein
MLETQSNIMLPVVQAFQAELAARQGRLAQSSRWASQAAPSQLQQSLPGFYGPQLALPKVLLAQDTEESRQQAADLLSQLRRFVETIHNTRFLIEVSALQALLLQAQGEESAALDLLEQAITLAQPGGFVRLFVDLGPKLEPLLAQLWQQGVAPAYIAQILGAFPGFVPKDGDRPMPGTRQPTHTELVETLTNREMDVLLLLAERKINKEIAGELGISTETVKRHTRNLYRKLDVRNRRQAAARARTLGILPAD